MSKSACPWHSRAAILNAVGCKLALSAGFAVKLASLGSSATTGVSRRGRSLLARATSASFRARLLLIAENQPRGSSHSSRRNPRLHQHNTTAYLVWMAMFRAGM
jgi:hypothetical protein